MYESSEEDTKEDSEEDSEEGYEISEFNMEHSLEKRMMVKFHNIQVDKLVKLSNFWYVKRTGKKGYNPVALKYPTKEYGNKFKKRLVEKRRKENDSITLALGGSPSFKGKTRLRQKVTPTKDDLKEKKTKQQPSKNTQKIRKSIRPTTRKREMGDPKTQVNQTKTTQKNTTTDKNINKKK